MKKTKSSKKIPSLVLFLLLATGMLVIASSASAEAVITKTALNGQNQSMAESGNKVQATVTVNLTEPSVWRSTAYKIGEGEWICVDTPDHEGNADVSETFPIIAPQKTGTEAVNFEVYENNNCTNGLGSPTSVGLSAAAISAFSGGGGWLATIFRIVILIVLALVLYFLVKKFTGKKKDSEQEGPKLQP